MCISTQKPHPCCQQHFISWYFWTEVCLFYHYIKHLSLSLPHTHPEMPSHIPIHSHSPWHTQTDTHVVPRRASSAAVLSPVRPDTSKEGHLRPALPSLNHFDGHHIPSFNPTLLTAQWCEHTAPPPWRRVTLLEPEWHTYCLVMFCTVDCMMNGSFSTCEGYVMA